MAELVDAHASGACIRKDVEVRVLFWAPSPCFLTPPNIPARPQKTAVYAVFLRLGDAVRFSTAH